MTETTETTNLPAKAEAPGTIAQRDEFADLAHDFDDGSGRFIETFGLSLPRIKTDFGKRGRGFVYPDDSDTRALSVVLLAIPPSRQWWEVSIDEGGGGTPPECRSFDLIRPDEMSPKPQAELCGKCPHSQWGFNKSGERQPPKCSQAVNCFVYDRAVESFFWLRFHGKALSPFRSHVSAIKARSLHAFAIETLVTLREETKGVMEFLVPQFSIGEHLSRDEVVPMREVAQAAMKFFEVAATEMASDDVVADGEVVGPFSDAPFTEDDETR